MPKDQSQGPDTVSFTPVKAMNLLQDEGLVGKVPISAWSDFCDKIRKEYGVGPHNDGVPVNVEADIRSILQKVKGGAPFEDAMAESCF